jgi:hypothetical protein
LNISVIRRIEHLEVQLKPSDPKLPPADFDLLIDSELAYFSRFMSLLRTKSRELGYGDGPDANLHGVGWFDLGDYDPMINEDVRAECYEALDEHEEKSVETFNNIIQKVLRLTIILSDEERDVVRRFNEAKRFFRNNLPGTKKEVTEEKLAKLGFQYNQIMKKHGATM